MSGKPIFFVILFLFFLTSCAAPSAPIQIASYPQLTPIAKYPPEPIFHRVFLEIVVSDLDRASADAMYLTSKKGGYLISSNSWYSDSRKVVSLDLAVPDQNFENLYRDLKGLGSTLDESILQESISHPPNDGYAYYSQITLHMLSTVYSFPPTQQNRWNPLHTLERAFRVSSSIFSFVADVIIWILVVGGPFILIAISIWVIHHRKQRPGEKQPDSDK